MNKIAALAVIGLMVFGAGFLVGGVRTTTSVQQQPASVTSEVVNEVSPLPEVVVDDIVSPLPSHAISPTATSRVAIDPDEVRVLHREIIRWDSRKKK